MDLRRDRARRGGMRRVSTAAALATLVLVGCAASGAEVSETSRPADVPITDRATVPTNVDHLMAGHDAASARASAKASETPFRRCVPGEKGGGYRVRANRISCREVRRSLPRMFAGAKEIERRESERVYRTRRGFTCLVQAGPNAAPPYTVFLCVRRDQTIFYRI
jgi:hypothetical protein